jgi:hypothetical protein
MNFFQCSFTYCQSHPNFKYTWMPSRMHQNMVDLSVIY